MSYIIEGAHGLALHPNDNLKYAAVIEPTGDIWTTDGDNSHSWWRTKTVVYKDGVIERRRTTKLPAFADSAARKYAKKVVPEGAIIGSISHEGEAIVFMSVATGEVVKVTRRWARDTREAQLLSPGQNWLGTPKFRRKESLRISTAHLYRWHEKNLEALRQTANRIMRSVEGKVVFAR